MIKLAIALLFAGSWTSIYRPVKVIDQSEKISIVSYRRIRYVVPTSEIHSRRVRASVLTCKYATKVNPRWRYVTLKDGSRWREDCKVLLGPDGMPLEKVD